MNLLHISFITETELKTQEVCVVASLVEIKLLIYFRVPY